LQGRITIDFMVNHQFQTLTELFLKAVERHSKPDAFLSKLAGQYHPLSSREALERAAALAVRLDALGVRRGDRVALVSENRVEWALADFGVLGLGAATVPVYPTLLEPDLEYILSDSGAKGVIVSTGAQLQKILKIRSRLPELAFTVAMDRTENPPDEVENWDDAVDAGRKATPDPVGFFRAKARESAPEDTASIIYTSGTTGQPKGVILTHSNIASNVRATQQLFPLTPKDVAISFLPLSHIFERTLDYQYFWLGVSIAYAESFEALPQNLLEVRPTVMGVVPRVLEKVHEKVLDAVRHAPASKQKLFRWASKVGAEYFPYRLERRAVPLGLRCKHAIADSLIFSKVRARLGGRVTTLISGAAPLARDLAEFFFAAGLPVYEGYGLTETSPVISVNCPASVRLGTVGRVIPGVEVKIDEAPWDGEDAAGGEILVRGPNVAPGYYRLEEENRRAFSDGWFRTGDLGRLDADGYLAITGRKKNLFKTSGGKFVSPEKLENLFQGHPYVSQVLVLGDARHFVSALIVPNFPRLEKYAQQCGWAFSCRADLVGHAEIQEFMQKKVDELCAWLPRHEKIKQIALLPQEFTIDSGELSPTQKIKRAVVEQRYREVVEEIYRRPAPHAETATTASG
jgi:long-chain acyl-CoA synthetase